MKKNVLAVINTHESFELENFETLKRYCPNPSFELFGITRFESAEKLFPIFGEAHLIPTIKSNLEIEKYASLLEEELSFDRQFIIDSDFLSSERFSINKIDKIEISNISYILFYENK